MGMLSMVLVCALGNAPENVWPINQRNFNIPIKVDPSRRGEIKELILFSSNDQGKTWNQVAVASSEKESFPYYAPTDGTFWFNIVVVDLQGNKMPADVTKTPPRDALKIMVDTLKPNVRITSAERQGDDIVVAWEIQEDNVDVSSMKLEYRPSDSPSYQWYTAPMAPTSTGTTRFRYSQPGPVSLRMQVSDQAGNATTAGAEVIAPPPVTSTTSYAGTQGSPPAPTTTSGWENPQTQPTQPENPRAVQQAFVAPAHQPGYDGNVVATSENVVPVSTSQHRTARTQVPLQIVNSTQLNLDYEVSKVGPSGVGRVELWMSQDDGRSWRRYSEDTDCKPPLTVDLPGEGIYGFCLVVQSKAGLGKKAPLAGDMPEIRIEVDTTPPVAKLFAPEQDPKRRDALTISWSATDRNLAANPITLQWTDKPGGTWENIGTDLPNSGRHAWQLPPNLPYRVYLRLLVRDTAGNMCVAETPEPVLVDLNEPEGRLLGVQGIARRP